MGLGLKWKILINELLLVYKYKWKLFGGDCENIFFFFLGILIKIGEVWNNYWIK